MGLIAYKAQCAGKGVWYIFDDTLHIATVDVNSHTVVWMYERAGYHCNQEGVMIAIREWEMREARP